MQLHTGLVDRHTLLFGPMMLLVQHPSSWANNADCFKNTKYAVKAIEKNKLLFNSLVKNIATINFAENSLR